MTATQTIVAGTAWALLLLAAPVDAAAQQREQQQFVFDLSAEPLAKALRDVAVQTGRNLIAPDELVERREAPPLSGTYTAEEAIGRLLEGSGLRARLVDGTLLIEQAPLAGAASAPAGSGPREDDIVVTGSHLRGASPASPVITVSRRQIEESAATSVEDLMRRLPQNQAAGVDQQNFGVPGTGSDITQFGAGLNLRGLGQRATLVLVNGRRVAPSDTGSFVDVSLLPITAIERVEVLTDGASATYGSDAVGGVVNFILRDDFSGIAPVIQAGTTTRGGGDQLLAGLTAGQRWSSGRALLSYEYREDRPIRAGDRGFTINLPADWFLLPEERRHGLYGSLRQDLPAGVTLDLSGLYSRRRTERTFFDASQIAIDAQAGAETLGGTAAFRLDTGSSWQIEATASYFRSRTREQQDQAGNLFNRSNTRNAYGELALKADGNLLDLPGGTVKLAVGAGVRRERFASLFATAVNVPTTVDAARTVRSLYGELNLPLIGPANRRPGIERLIITAAGRYEHYQGIGSAFDPKAGLLWSPVEGLNLRGSYGTSFRAPLLSESNGYYNIFLFPVAILYRDPSQATPGVGAAVIGSNPNVQPERSTSLALGVDVMPVAAPGLRISGTFYKISFTDRIALPSPQVDLIGVPAFAPTVTLDPDVGFVSDLFAGANQLLDFSGPGFTNGGATPADVVAVVDDRVANTAATWTSGLDLLVSYAARAGDHDLRIDLNANRVLRFNDKLTSASPWIRRLNTPFNPVRWRARAGLSWKRGPVGAMTFLNYAGSYRDNRGVVTRPVRSFTTIDAGVTLDGSATEAAWFRPFKLAFNVQNLFDRSPPHLAPAGGSTRGVGFDPVNASGRGRTISLQLRASW